MHGDDYQAPSDAVRLLRVLAVRVFVLAGLAAIAVDGLLAMLLVLVGCWLMLRPPGAADERDRR